jgi:type I restriction enzyme R subunit
MNKIDLPQRYIRNKFIQPAIQQAGWQQHQFREEISLTDGRGLSGQPVYPRKNESREI